MNGGTAISFNSNSLQTDNYITADIKHESVPQKDAPVYSLAHANRSSIPYINYPQKVITVTGKIVGSGISDVEGRIDTFKSYFATEVAQALDIAYAGGTRRYTALATTVDVDRPGGLDWANFTVVFTCTKPFGTATAAVQVLDEEDHTTSPASFTPLTFAGSAPWQQPKITITITDVTDGDSFITVANDVTKQSVSVGAVFADGDVLVIDCAERKVTLNTLPVDYVGSFPEFANGAGATLNYDDGFTARDVDILVECFPLYL